MSSPLEKIRRGVLSGRWADVAEGYAAMTGERLECPAAEPPHENPLREAMIEIRRLIVGVLNDADAADEADEKAAKANAKRPQKKAKAAKAVKPASPPPAEVPPAEVPSRTRPDYTLPPSREPAGDGGGRPCRAEQVSYGFKNEFVDDRKAAAADAKIDRKLTKGLVPAERRPAAREVRVACSRCGESSVLPASLVPPGAGTESDERISYVCDRCLAGVRR